MYMDQDLFLNFSHEIKTKNALEDLVRKIACDAYVFTLSDTVDKVTLRKNYFDATGKRLSPLFWLDEIILLQLKYHSLDQNIVFSHDLISFNECFSALNAKSVDEGIGSADKVNVLGIFAYGFYDWIKKRVSIPVQDPFTLSPLQEIHECKKLIDVLIGAAQGDVRMGNVKNIMKCFNIQSRMPSVNYDDAAIDNVLQQLEKALEDSRRI